MAISVLRKWMVLPGSVQGGTYRGSVLVSFAISSDGDPQADVGSVPNVARWQDLVDQMLTPAATSMQLGLEVRGDKVYPSFDAAGGPVALTLAGAVGPSDGHALWNAYMRPTDPDGSSHWRTLGATLQEARPQSFHSDSAPQPSRSFPGKACIDAGRSMYLHSAADRRILSSTFTLAPDVMLDANDPLQQAKSFLEAATKRPAALMQFDAGSAGPENPLTERRMTFEEAISAAGKIPELLRRLRLCIDFSLTPGRDLTNGAIRAVPVQPDQLPYEHDMVPWTAFSSDAALGAFRAADDVPGATDTFTRVFYNGWIDLTAKDRSGTPVFAVDQIDPMAAALTALSAAEKQLKPIAGTVSFEARDDPRIAGLTVTTPPFLAIFASDAPPVQVPSHTLTLDPFSTIFFSVDAQGAINRAPGDDPATIPSGDLRLYGFITGESSVIAYDVLASIGIDTPEIMASKMHGLSSGDPTILYGERAQALDRRLGNAHAIHALANHLRTVASFSDAHRERVGNLLTFEDGDLTAHDLMRGVAVEVMEKSKGIWRPICRRRVTYRVPGVEPIEFDEEHAIDVPPLRDLSSSTPRLCVLDHLATWPEGNSPVAPSGLGGVGDDGGVVKNAVGGPDKIATETKPIGPIPALRFGRTYRFRVGAIDVAGRRVASGDGTPYASSEFTYRRYEPVAAPIIVLPKPLNDAAEPGEGVTTLVFRGHATGKLPSSYEPHRHILPPRCIGAFAALHGAMDDAHPATAYDWWKRTARYPADAGENIDAGIGCINIANLPADPGADINAALPDPMVRNYLVTGVPGAGGPLRLPLYPELPHETWAWPNPIPWRIVVSATDDIGVKPEIDLLASDGRGERFAQLRVYLHRAQRVTVSIACEITEAQRDLMGIWNDIVAAGASSPIDPAAFWDEVRNHGHWLVNPAVEIDLVHAVVEPMFAPSTSAAVDPSRVISPREQSPPHRGPTIEPEETLDGTSVQFRLERYMPNAGVERLECRLAWTEWLDLGRGMPAPTPIGRCEVVHVESLPPVANGWRVLRFAKTFDSPRAKDCTLSHTVTSRYGQFVTENPAKTATAVDPAGVLVRNSVRPRPVVVRTADIALASDPPYDDLGARDRGTKTTVIRVRFERPAYQSGLNERIAVVLADSLALDVPPNGDFKEPPLVSLAGRDPRMTTGPVQPLDKSQTGLFIRPPGADPIVNGVRHHQLDRSITLIPYEMRYDAGEDCWYIDVEIDGFAAYAPFVKLAVLRYQRDSIWDPAEKPDNRFNRACSDIVTVDPLPIHPSRTGMVDRATQTNGVQSARVAVHAAVVAPGTHFVAQLLVPRDRDAGGPPFQERGAPVPLTADAAGTTYSGTVSSDHAGPWKVRISEFETISGEREVYFDEFDIPGS